MNDEKRDGIRNDDTREYESNAARRLRALGGGEDTSSHADEPIKVDKLSNFWYHNKVLILVAVVFAFIIGVAASQYATHSNPDVIILYAGPVYITPNAAQAISDDIASVASDYNGDGKTYVLLNSLVFMTNDQADRFVESQKAEGEDASIDTMSSAKTSERFTWEIFSGNSSICILSKDQYEQVKSAGGFMPLSELFDYTPDGAIDEYGIKLSEMKICKFYSSFSAFPDDAIIALRKLSTASALANKAKAEEKHGYSRDLFFKIVNFEYPQGYTAK